MGSCRADLESKNWASKNLKDQESLAVIPGIFELHYVENDAIAFSLLHSLEEGIRLPLILVLSMGATSIIIVLIWIWRHRPFKELLPLILILGGALGNVIDRINNRYVVDFIFFHYKNINFPIFNIADILVFWGVLLLMYYYWKGAYRYSSKVIE